MHAKIRLSFVLTVVNGLFWPAWIKAQQLVEYDEPGTRFEVPAGWSSRESDAGYLPAISDRDGQTFLDNTRHFRAYDRTRRF